jgi:hypothetical protein
MSNIIGRPDNMFPGNPAFRRAFVAAAAMRVNIYVLRPPDHKQLLLANAQYDWLAADGVARGWQRISNGVEAQRRANQGWLVLASYRNRHADKPGHIAIVRPSDKSAEALLEEGPQVTQAGLTNYHSVALRIGLAGHPAAWRHHEVAFYGHVVDFAALTN